MSLWVKDPADIAWYELEWTDFLDVGETITTYTIVCDSALTKVSDSQDGAFTYIKVSGGTEGGQSLITGTIDTSNTNHYEVEKYIYIVKRIITP